MYEVKKIDVSAWGTVYEKTLATASTWRELMRKENSWWFVGKGADIFRNGERIGHTSDLITAEANRQDVFTGRQYEVRLSDFMAAVSESNE